jgi:hypothetical protein
MGRPIGRLPLGDASLSSRRERHIGLPSHLGLRMVLGEVRRGSGAKPHRQEEEVVTDTAS